MHSAGAMPFAPPLRKVALLRLAGADALKALPAELYPRGWTRIPENRRVFGYAERSSPRKAWDKAIAKAKIERLPFHAAGRHGFGQEMNVCTPIDEKAASAFGGWADIKLMKKTYTQPHRLECHLSSNGLKMR